MINLDKERESFEKANDVMSYRFDFKVDYIFPRGVYIAKDDVSDYEEALSFSLMWQCWIIRAEQADEEIFQLTKQLARYQKAEQLIEQKVTGSLDHALLLVASLDNLEKAKTTIWIPVSERLPEINEYVLTYAVNDARQVGVRLYSSDSRVASLDIKSRWFWGIQNEYALPDQVTHWAYLIDKPQ